MPVTTHQPLGGATNGMLLRAVKPRSAQRADGIPASAATIGSPVVGMGVAHRV
jgi:hypothetical protein